MDGNVAVRHSDTAMSDAYPGTKPIASQIQRHNLVYACHHGSLALVATEASMLPDVNRDGSGKLAA